jgi:WD40 repeat protein
MGLKDQKTKIFIKHKEKSKMKKSKMILLMLAILIVVDGKAKAQDGSEYLLWEKTPDYSLFSFAISGDETKVVVTGSYNNDESYVLKAYDILTGNEIFSKPITTRPTSIARFTSDNKYLLIYNEKSIDFYDPKTYNIVKTITTGGISFSADNKIFSKTEDDYIFRITIVR